MPDPASRILRDQNGPAAAAVARAVATSHKRAQRLAAAGTAGSVLAAAAGLAGVFVTGAATAITVAGAAWALLYAVGLTSWEGQERDRAARIQEMFDVDLFALDWNPLLVGDRVGPQEINRLGARYRGQPDKVADYYEIPDLPYPFDVLACQQQNLGWGARVHRRYAYLVLACVCVWSGAGLLVGTLADLTVTEILLRWYIPSLGGIMLGLGIFRQQHGVTKERHRVLQLVNARIDALAGAAGGPRPATELLPLARQVQDVVFLTRQRATRVPDWLYRRHRADDQSDFRAAVEHLESRVRRLPSASAP
ncbi:MAG TPA: S-4TM family putative pore-forming effector [Trebonia sp.]